MLVDLGEAEALHRFAGFLAEIGRVEALASLPLSEKEAQNAHRVLADKYNVLVMTEPPGQPMLSQSCGGARSPAAQRTKGDTLHTRREDLRRVVNIIPSQTRYVGLEAEGVLQGLRRAAEVWDALAHHFLLLATSADTDLPRDYVSLVSRTMTEARVLWACAHGELPIAISCAQDTLG